MGEVEVLVDESLEVDTYRYYVHIYIYLYIHSYIDDIVVCFWKVLLKLQKRALHSQQKNKHPAFWPKIKQAGQFKHFQLESRKKCLKGHLFHSNFLHFSRWDHLAMK